MKENYLPTMFQQFIHISRYARWNEKEKRRETWQETVKRYFDFFEKHLKETCNYTLTETLRDELEQAVLNLEVMPSMRALMTAGPALERDNMAGFNCSAVIVDRIRVFDEILGVLLNGTGVGFSVERRFVENLPIISEDFHETDTTIHVADSKIGWAKAFKELISLLYIGQIPKWDLSKVRPAGSLLKTFGGRASGPEPLDSLFRFSVEMFKSAKGRRLYSIECHDLICKIGEIVVVGGVRRAALISLSNLTDERMRKAKSGQWWIDNPQRALANNSTVYTENPDIGIFMKEWQSLYESKSGERGIVNRVGLEKKVLENGRREGGHNWILNPCAEIILKDRQTCNLSEIVARFDDNLESLMRKARLASILGTFQSTLTNFKYVSSEWKKNAEEERLLGVSITGIMNNKILGNMTKDLPDVLNELKNEVINTNKEFAKQLGINQSAATTCVKPSGTVSCLVNSSSGIHTAFSRYYIRSVRADKKDPLYKFMEANNFPCEDEINNPSHTAVFYFPIETPKNSIFRDERTALEQLELWKVYKEHWCEHNPSITVYVKEDEWLEVAAWVYRNFNIIGGISFLPHTDHIYKQAPYQECTKEEYQELMKKFPKEINWSDLSIFESEDNTNPSATPACTGNVCEVVDI